ncbi:MAG: hypothetical protein V7K69_03365 [Nostoc sp.]|uniref:hypothetical protein n=1 Tax=Nostoc sp. TaxID=1180 RepID=UPI002FFAEFC7
MQDLAPLLYGYLSHQPCEGTYIINVPADLRRKRIARVALLVVRCGRVKIQYSDKLSVFGYPQSVTLYAVEAQEVLLQYLPLA